MDTPGKMERDNFLNIRILFQFISENFEKKEALKIISNCRLVCTGWEMKASEIINSLACPYLTSIHAESDPAEYDIESYKQYSKSNPLLQFSNFKLKGLSMKNILEAEFLHAKGVKIKYLSLDFNEGEDSWKQRDTRKFRHFLLTVGDKLEHLAITGLPFAVDKQRFRLHDGLETLSTNIKKLYIDWVEEGDVSFYVDLLRSAPLLNTLQINHEPMEQNEDSESEEHDSDTEEDDSEDDAMEEEIGEEMDEHEQDIKEQNVNKFPRLISLLPEIASTLNKVEIMKYSTSMHDIYPLCQLKLITLDLFGLVIDAEGTKFTRFLESLSPTLKYISLSCLSREEQEEMTILVRFPVLPNLLRFKLGIMSDDEAIHIFPINYPKIFPQLENAYISTGINDVDSILTMNQKRSEKVKKLTLEVVKAGNTISRAARLFPNIKTLDIFEKCLFEYSQVWSYWPHLESLTITFNEDAETAQLSPDALFTGLTTDECEKISTMANPLDFRCDDAHPSIVNLKGLKHLFINNDNQSRDIDKTMSNASIWGIAKLPRLKVLQLPKTHRMNESGILTLKRALPGVQITTEKVY